MMRRREALASGDGRAVSLIAARCSGRVRAENWPQWRGPGRAGRLDRAAVADRVGARQEHRVEDARLPAAAIRRRSSGATGSS